MEAATSTTTSSRLGCPRLGGTGHHGLGWAPYIILDPLWANLMEREANSIHGRPLPLVYSTKGWPSDSQMQGARGVR